jgi:hypothetical protein
LGKAAVNPTNSIVRALNFDQEDGFLETGLGGKLRGVEDSSGCWGDLTTTSVDSISVESDVLDVEADASHVFFRHNTFFGSPLEGSLARVLNFVHELALRSCVNKQVCTGGLRSEAPNLLGFVGIPAIFVLEDLVADLDVLFSSNLLIFNCFRKLVAHWGGNAEDSVVLVG